MKELEKQLSKTKLFKGLAVQFKDRIINSDILNKLEIPTAKDEAWKYTNIGGLFTEEYYINTNEIDIKSYLQPFDNNFIKLIFVNGFYSKALSDTSSEINVVVVQDKSQNNLSTDLVFDFLNQVYATCEIEINVKKSIVKPILIVHVLQGDNNVIAQPRLKINVSQKVKSEIYEVFYGNIKTSGLINTFTEMNIAPRANIFYTRLQNEGEACQHINNWQVNQEKNSVFSANILTLGQALFRNNIQIDFNDEFCSADINCALIGDNNQHVDNNVLINHKYPNCQSNQLCKSCLFDKSMGIFTGKIFVHPQAQKTLAYQQSRSILISEDAQMNVRPQLEIYADDVKCSHGATIGQLDKQALLYMQNRGIDLESAKYLLIQSFMKEIIEKIPSESFKKYINELVNNKLKRNT